MQFTFFRVKGPSPQLHQDKTFYNIGNLGWNTPSVQKAKRTLTKTQKQNQASFTFPRINLVKPNPSICENELLLQMLHYWTKSAFRHPSGFGAKSYSVFHRVTCAIFGLAEVPTFFVRSSDVRQKFRGFHKKFRCSASSRMWGIYIPSPSFGGLAAAPQHP